MHEFSEPFPDTDAENAPAPGAATAARVGGLADSVFENAAEVPEFVQFEVARDGGEVREPVTAARFRDEVNALAKGLLAEGVRFGDRVGIMSRTRYEWTLFDYALWTIGAQPVPVYPTSSPDQVRWILGHAGAVACVVENDEHAMTVGSVIGELPGLGHMWQIDAGAVEDLWAAGFPVADETVHRHRLAVTPESVASVVYTSGTTGRPKGCVLTHANMMAEVDTFLSGWGSVLGGRGGEPAAALMFLPLAHVMGRMLQVGCVRGRVRAAHQPSLTSEDLLRDMASFRPTIVFGVPHIFERVFNAVRRAALESGQEEAFDKAVDTAVRWAEAQERQAFGEGPGPGAALRVQHRMYDRAVYSKVREVFGGRLRTAISGGSALQRRLGLFFAGAGVTVHEGYGLTETCSASTCNPPGRVRFGTVGPPMPGSSVRIAEDGEVLLRGGHVFTSYLDDPGATEEVLHDGWLATGDLGTLDRHGYLAITGRKKEVIVTSGGKSVSPMPLEDRVRAHPLVAQCVVVGENRPYIGALITLDPEALGHWQRMRGQRATPLRDAARDPAVRAEVQRAVSAANALVSKAESIREFRIVGPPFAEEAGLLTPSLKLRRHAVLRACADEIESIYSG
ncbi:AMP-dependent synthetase/ligase [Streptomyces sp. NPDC059637]|uniref:AMP-dependent synthetase/ligase n=1 Tax=Streptomyces sp. NPDC059637 TaxID=3347752 RepID=UPI0036A5D768